MTYKQLIQDIAHCNHMLRSNPPTQERKLLVLMREQLNMDLQSMITVNKIADLVFS